jgi:hypothetical protein
VNGSGEVYQDPGTSPSSDAFARCTNKTPGSANYSVSLTLRRVSSANNLLGPAGRLTATNSGYFVVYNKFNNRFEMYRYVSGTATGMGTPYSVALVDGNTYVCKLEMLGDQIAFYLDGTLRISDTSNHITAAGYAGICGSTAATSTTGMRGVSITADDDTGGGGGATGQPTLRRWGGVVGMSPGGILIGRKW